MSTSTVMPLLSEFTATYSLLLGNSRGFNHATHGIVALYRLGADSPRIQRYIDTYLPKLQLRSTFIEEGIQEKKSDPSKTLGPGKPLFHYYDEYDQQLQKNKGSLELLISQNLPLLAPGIGGGAFHGIIHVGYGYASNNTHMVTEGLAFLHQTSLPPIVSNDSPLATATQPRRSILEIVNEVRSNKAISEFIESELSKQEWKKVNAFRFGYFMNLVMNRYGNELVNWANAIELPIDADAKSLGKWLVSSVITVYATSEQRNDFYLLHGVTSAWALLQVLSLLDNPEKELIVVRHFLGALLAVYIAQGAPNIRLDWLADDQEEAEQSWDTLIERTLAKDFDEHVFKVVMSCHEMDLENSDAKLTRLYKKAASVALDYPLFFHPVPKVQ